MTRIPSARHAWSIAVVVGASWVAQADRLTATAAACGADYRIVEVSTAPGGAGNARVALQGADRRQRIELRLPRAIVEQQRLARGDVVRTSKRVYGFEFARGDTREVFYLVLADDWRGQVVGWPARL